MWLDIARGDVCVCVIVTATNWSHILPYTQTDTDAVLDNNNVWAPCSTKHSTHMAWLV